eukprot:jgi/Hompol1/410/HPOL_004370-RA
MAPKPTRKKKIKQEDFKKKKLKVGKKLAAADNQTDVSFKSQKIAVRSQKLATAEDHERAATTAGKLARMKDLLIQSRHYSPQSRKGALAQMQDLLTSEGTEFAVLNLASVANEVLALILDENHSVRNTLLTFLSAYFSWIDEVAIKPFGAIIVAYASSAMSHITDTVRVDGLRLLKLTLSRFPAIIVKQSHVILPHFLDLLSAHGKSRDGRSGRSISISSEFADHKGREQLLDTFYTFLTLVLDARSPEQIHKHETQTKSHGDSATLWNNNLFEQIHPLLIDFWIEASDVFKTSKLAWTPSLGICQRVIQIILSIVHSGLKMPLESAVKCSALFTKHVTALFPFGALCSPADENIHKVLVHMNLGYAKIILSMLEANDATMTVDKQAIVVAASAYFVEVLDSSQLLSAHAPSLDLAVLDSITRDLSVAQHDETALEALIRFQINTKSMQLAFGAFEILAGLESELRESQEYKRWTCNVPKQLVQLKTWNTDFSMAIILFLRQILIFDQNHQQDSINIMSQLELFFYGKSKKGKDARFGPFLDLPGKLQQAAIELLYYLPRWSATFVKALAMSFTRYTSDMLLQINSAAQVAVHSNWSHRRLVVDAVVDRIAWNLSIPSLFEVLNMPVDGVYAVLALLAKLSTDSYSGNLRPPEILASRIDAVKAFGDRSHAH